MEIDIKNQKFQILNFFICVEVWGIFPEICASLCLPTVETTKICLHAEEQTEGMQREAELCHEFYKGFYFIQRHTSWNP